MLIKKIFFSVFITVYSFKVSQMYLYSSFEIKFNTVIFDKYLNSYENNKILLKESCFSCSAPLNN